MRLEIQVNGKNRTVELVHQDGRVVCTLDGRAVDADAVEVATSTYSIILEGQSYEVRVSQLPDGLHVTSGGREYIAEVHGPRQWRGRSGAAAQAEGRQQIIAPMPGRIVRVLVSAGDAVEAGQGLVVVEAMKMQNEIKSPKSGKVERVLVSEGQNVNAGEVLVVVA
jgi:biotin carboxyl carrier protein